MEISVRPNGRPIQSPIQSAWGVLLLGKYLLYQAAHPLPLLCLPLVSADLSTVATDCQSPERESLIK